MLRASVVVIASVPKKYLVFLTIISATLLMLGFGIAYRSENSDALRLGNETFTTEFMRTETDRAKGLSGRSEIGSDHAMIFMADRSYQQCFWMKDMQFAIDIIWLDADRRIAAIEQNVSPASYPASFCHDGKYVIEVTAGTIDRLGLQKGSLARF